MSTLSLVLLLQGMFPSQLHTKLVMDANGRLIEVCTLSGIKTVALDDAGNPIEGKGQYDGQPSPAMLFSQLMAEAVSNVAVPVVDLEEIPSYTIPYTNTLVIPEASSGLMPIRAPPIA